MSLGEGSPNAIADKYRYLHESMVGTIDLFATSNSNYGLSAYFSPYVQTYDGFYFTPEREPCDARYLFDKALHDEDKVPVEYNVKSFEKYLADIAEKDYYGEDFKYEALEIVEKEENTTNYGY